MKKILLLIIIFESSLLSLYGQNWMWGRQPIPSPSGSAEGEPDHSVAIDKYGNALVTGPFWGSLQFGTYLLSYPSNEEAFVVKYDTNGNVIWAKAAAPVGSSGFSYATSIALDRAGNSYITGYFRDTVSFGSFTLYNSNNWIVFIAKYDVNGNVLWAKQAKPANATSYARGQEITVDKFGNAYISGILYDTVLFDTIPLILTGGNNFLAKYDANGNIKWARKDTLMVSYSLTTDTSNNLYSAGEHILSEPALVKYNTNGSLLWLKQERGTGQGHGVSLAADGANHIYMAGTFHDSLYFGPIGLYYPHQNGVDEGIFLAKFDLNGNIVWAEQGFDSTWSSVAIAVNRVKNGEGYFLLKSSTLIPETHKLTFGNKTFTFSATHLCAEILLQFDSAGKTMCGDTFSEGDEDDADGLAVDSSGMYAYIVGDLTENTIFGKDTLTSVGDNLFIARWHPCSGYNSDAVNEVDKNDNSRILFPNPNSGAFTIQLSEASGQKSVVEVYNALGEKIYSQTFNTQNSTLSINLGNQPPGIYLYRVLTPTGNLADGGKFIIE